MLKYCSHTSHHAAPLALAATGSVCRFPDFRRPWGETRDIPALACPSAIWWNAWALSPNAAEIAAEVPRDNYISCARGNDCVEGGRLHVPGELHCGVPRRHRGAGAPAARLHVQLRLRPHWDVGRVRVGPDQEEPALQGVQPAAAVRGVHVGRRVVLLQELRADADHLRLRAGEAAAGLPGLPGVPARAGGAGDPAAPVPVRRLAARPHAARALRAAQPLPAGARAPQVHGAGGRRAQGAGLRAADGREEAARRGQRQAHTEEARRAQERVPQVQGRRQRAQRQDRAAGGGNREPRGEERRVRHDRAVRGGRGEARGEARSAAIQRVSQRSLGQPRRTASKTAARGAKRSARPKASPFSGSIIIPKNPYCHRPERSRPPPPAPRPSP